MIIKGFTRVNEHGDPELLENTELTELTNGKIKGGKIYRRDALVQYNSNDAGGGIKSLHDVEDEDGNNYLLAVQGTALKKSANGTGSWSDIITGLTEAKARIRNYDDKFYLTNKNDNIKWTDLTNNGNLAISEVDVTQMSTAGASGGSLANGGKYKWKFVYKTFTGERSNPSRAVTQTNESNLDIGIGSNNTKITFSSIPESSDTRVPTIEIYRTKNDGDVYYLVDRISNGVTSYSDTMADTGLSTADTLIYYNVPKKAKFIEVHRERLFLANTAKYNLNSVEQPAYSDSVAITDSYDPGNGMADGVYRWKVAFMDNKGIESELTEYYEHLVIANGDPTDPNLKGGKVEIGGTAVPITDEINTVKLYRTMRNETTPYYLVEWDVPSNAATWVDTTHDVDLEGTTYPESGEGVDDNLHNYDDEIVWSDIGEPISIQGISSLRVFAGNGGSITELIDNFDGLLVFKENLIAKIFTEGSPFNWQVLRISENIGCDEPDSVAAIDRVVYFMHNRKVYRYGQSVEDISLEFQTTLQSVDTVHDAAFSTKYNWYILLVTISSTRYILVRDEDAKSWYKFNVNDGQFTPEAVVTRQYEDSGEFTFAHNNMGYLNSFDDSTESDQYSSSYIVVPVTIATKTFYLSDPIAKIRAREILANYDKKANNDVVIKVEDTFNLASRTFTHNTNSGNVFVRKATDSLTGTLKESTTVKFTISGGGINSFNSLKFKYKALRRGRG